MVLRGATSSLGALEGVGPENRDFFGPKWHSRTYRAIKTTGTLIVICALVLLSLEVSHRFIGTTPRVVEEILQLPVCLAQPAISPPTLNLTSISIFLSVSLSLGIK
jgi:hypothetical protein